MKNPHAVRIRGSQYNLSVNIWCGLVGNCLLSFHELPVRLTDEGFLHFNMYNLPVLLESVPLEKKKQSGLY